MEPGALDRDTMGMYLQWCFQGCFDWIERMGGDYETRCDGAVSEGMYGQ